MIQKNLKLLTIYLFILLGQSVNAQNQAIIDSLEGIIPTVHDSIKSNIYAQLYKLVFEIDLDKAKVYANLGEETAYKSRNSNAIAQSQNLLGIHNYMISEYDSAVFYYEKALEEFILLGNKESVLKIKINIASVYQDKGNINESLNTYLDVLKYLEEQKIEGDVLGTVYWNVGSVNLDLKKDEEAITWFEKAIRIYKELKDTLYVVDLEYQIALANSNIENYEVAELKFNDCADYYRNHNMQGALAGALDNLGSIYNSRKEYNKAEPLLLEALEIAEKGQSQFLPGQIYRRLTDLYIGKNNLRKAEEFALKSQENALQLGRTKKVITDYFLLSEIYEKQGRVEESLKYYKKFHAQNDSIFGLEKMNSINAMQLEYQENKNQLEVALLEEKNHSAQLRQKGLIAGIILLLSLFGVFIYAIRQRLSKNKIEKEKVDQELDFSKKELSLKTKELTAYALQIAHKNEVLEGIKSEVSDIKDNNARALQKIVNTINFNQNDDNSWEGFRKRFTALHKDFEPNVKEKFPTVSSNELRLMSLLKMNLSNKEIANIVNISPDGIKKARYRLRKKLELTTEESLEDFVLSL